MPPGSSLPWRRARERRAVGYPEPAARRGPDDGWLGFGSVLIPKTYLERLERLSDALRSCLIAALVLFFGGMTL